MELEVLVRHSSRVGHRHAPRESGLGDWLLVRGGEKGRLFVVIYCIPEAGTSGQATGKRRAGAGRATRDDVLDDRIADSVASHRLE